MKRKFLQIIYDMRHQPLIVAVSLIATALSVFLILMVTIVQQVKVMPFAPESCRDRLMIGAYLEITRLGSAGLSQNRARMLYDDLETIDKSSYMTLYTISADLIGPTATPFSAKMRKADAGFWEIFDHTLLEGRYYTPEEADALAHVAVITESVAKQLFGSQQAIGSQFKINYVYYTVVGVVRDNSSLALYGSGEVFIPTGPADESLNFGQDDFGQVAVALLPRPGVTAEQVRAEVKTRYAAFDTELQSSGIKTVYHEQPFDIEQLNSLSGSNVTPDVESDRRTRFIIYLLLLLIPAINLSTMLHGRLRRRMNEIGIRRAFGCTRSRIMTDILMENMLLSVAGGLIGLILSIIFALSYSGLYDTELNLAAGERPSIWVLLNPIYIVVAFAACFLLNIFSAMLPAWNASKMPPVKAINER